MNHTFHIIEAFLNLSDNVIKFIGQRHAYFIQCGFLLRDLLQAKLTWMRLVT